MSVNNNYILSEIAEYLKINPEYNTVIQELVKRVEKQTLVIVISKCDTFDDKLLSDLFSLCNDLHKRTLNIGKILNLFIFLLAEEIGKNNNNYHEVKLDKFEKKEVEDWFTAQNNSCIPNNYKWEKEKELINNYEQSVNKNPHNLIDKVCQDVFDLNNGIADIEHYWREFA